MALMNVHFINDDDREILLLLDVPALPAVGDEISFVDRGGVHIVLRIG